MGIQILPENPSLGQALGKGFTSGLAETLPKYAERGALSQGLKNLAERAGNMSPLELVAEAQKIPGMTDQKLQSIMPFLEGQRAETAALKEYGMTPSYDQGVQDTQTESVIPTSQGPEVIETATERPIGKKGISSPVDFNQIDEDREYFGQARDPSYIAAQAAITRKKSGRSPEEERKHLSEKYANLQQREKEYLANKTELQTQLRDRVTLISQGAGFSAIPDEYQEQLISKADEMLKKDPSNPARIVENLKGEVQRFMETRASVKNFKPGLFGKGTSKRRLDSLRKAYEEKGMLSLFEKDLTNHLDLTAPYAFKLTYGESPEIKSTLSRLKNAFNPGEKRSQDVYEKIAKTLTPEDSLLGIGLDLRKKGYNPEEFMRYITENNRDILSTHQLREIEQGTRQFTPSLSDLYYVGI